MIHSGQGVRGAGDTGRGLPAEAFAPWRLHSDLVARTLMCWMLIWQIAFSVQHLRAALLSPWGCPGAS